ncbi:MAG: hypothetical protein AAGI52_13260 [Bacteroidota bacterium]
MKPAERERWEEIRLQGQARYILVQGVVRWGGTMFLFFCVFYLMTGAFSPSRLLISAVVWPLAGVLFGAVTWAINERRYRSAADPDAA